MIIPFEIALSACAPTPTISMKSVAVVSEASAFAAPSNIASTSVPEAVPDAAVLDETNFPVAESYTPTHCATSAVVIVVVISAPAEFSSKLS